MNQAIYSRSATILKRFTAANLNQLQVIYEPGTTSPWDLLQTTRYYGFVTDLRMKVSIRSLAEQELPELDVTSSRTERITELRDLDWMSARKEFSLYLETSNAPICQIARMSLQNRQPYYHVNMLPYFSDNGIINVAADARILGSITDAGYGLLGQNDEIIIFGSVKEEVTTLPTEPRKIEFAQSHSWTVSKTAIPILPANPSRLQATLVNRSNSGKIYINYGASAEVGKGICLMPQGGTYEINRTNPYQGMITGISDTDGSLLSGLECV